MVAGDWHQKEGPTRHRLVSSTGSENANDAIISVNNAIVEENDAMFKEDGDDDGFLGEEFRKYEPNRPSIEAKLRR